MAEAPVDRDRFVRPPLSWREHYRRIAVRRRFKQALQTGHVQKPARCSQCGAEPPRKDLHGHHTDYERPLQVVWLCRDCHREAHANG